MVIGTLLYAAALMLISPQEPARVVVEVRLKTVDVTVTDSDGQPVRTLTKEDFEVYEDGTRQEIQSFDATYSPHRILAVSLCSYFRAQDAAFQKSFGRFVETVRPQNRLALVEFVKEFHLLQDWDLLHGSVAIPLRKPSVCDDPVDRPLNLELENTLKWIISKTQGVSGRKALVWFGDFPLPRQQQPRSQDPSSVMSILPNPVKAEADVAFQAALKAVQNIGLTFNFVMIKGERVVPRLGGLATSEVLSQAYENDYRERLLRLQLAAEATGGQLIMVKKTDDILPLVDRLNREPGTFYNLGYSPTSKSQEKHRIEVRVRDPKLRVLQSP